MPATQHVDAQHKIRVHRQADVSIICSSGQ